MEALRVENLSKTFGNQRVLDNVDLSIARGEVHALLGQNGSGKSTFIKVLSGYHQPDPGASAWVGGTAVHLGNAHDSHSAGLRFVHQDLGLVNDLSIMENFMLGEPYPTGFGFKIKWGAVRRRTEQALARLGLSLDVSLAVGDLGLADRTAVAIARALPRAGAANAVLVLDEPTAALPPDDVERLFVVMRRLRDEGTSLLLVSHHLDEVLSIADRVSVLRDGVLVATGATSDLDRRSLGELIVGRAVEDFRHSGEVASSGAVRLHVDRLSGGTISELSLDVRDGEIVGVAGITGSGRESVAPLITGRLGRGGSVSIGGTPLKSGYPHLAYAQGMASIPGERGRFGVFPNFGVRENLTAGDLKPCTKGLRLDVAAERAEAVSWIDRLGVVTRGPDAPIGTLSGGNQQKVLVARALRRNPRVLVLDDPTQGIDVGARQQVHSIVHGAAATGIAVLLVSTDSEELERICDRVAVMSRGVVAQWLHRGRDLSATAIDHIQMGV